MVRDSDHYNVFRDYDPQTGRYVESDPVGLKGGINTYAYASDNSVNAFDSLGLAYSVVGGWVECSPGRNSQLIPMTIQFTGLDKKCGIGDCIVEHEKSHIADINSWNNQVCRYVRPGVPFSLPEPAGYKSEVKAYGVELQCLLKKLTAQGCDKNCNDAIVQRMQDVLTLQSEKAAKLRAWQ